VYSSRRSLQSRVVRRKITRNCKFQLFSLFLWIFHYVKMQDRDAWVLLVARSSSAGG
jgi:hypothetical protein